MKTVAVLSMLSASVLAHPSGLWWGTDTCYPSPENTDNSCLEPQRDGFKWSDLADGDNWSYEGFNFVGFSPRDVCNASNGKCIEAKLSRDDGYAVRIEATEAPFSVEKFHLSTSRETLLRLNYEMADGSTCHELASSSPDGVDVVNQQCGGAVAVEFTLPEDSKFGECDLNIHEISFDCSDGSKPPGDLPPPSSKPHPPHVSTKTVILSAPVTFTSTITKSVVTHEVSTVWTTAEVTETHCPATATYCPGHSTVTSTYTRSTTFYPTSWEIATPSLVSSSISTATATPDSSVVPAPCPEVVPKCINTWLSIPKCDSNSDAACFCPSSEFTGNVDSCIHAWAKSDQERDSALSYFAGICAPYVPQNPGLIDIVPTSTSSASQTSQVMTSMQSITPAVTDSHTTPCTTVTWSTQTVTVPRVEFTTIPMGSTTSVCLVAATVTPTGYSSSAKTSCSSFKTITTVIPCACETSDVTTTAVSSPTETPPIPTLVPSHLPTTPLLSELLC
ncbi:hypothetical protein N7509_004921 [Penicillium cosmopolitanum]|uniref:CFEM domain-containing protein n=1 Tax=Penicillium cosmopolitanum TaxID=1131564 RepID=A0A9W9W1G0_9EURO|nr:uncharacterized protein N7509_004921 [Penicillium cosmopolitanum]KAJ5396808.1 hypothetical protein N7509_004921 [Penicillium cosmopolitanum]